MKQIFPTTDIKLWLDHCVPNPAPQETRFLKVWDVSCDSSRFPPCLHDDIVIPASTEVSAQTKPTP